MFCPIHVFRQAPFGPREGEITLIERCYSVGEAGTFSRGDLLVGTYQCFRDNTDRDVSGQDVVRVEDIRRFELEVTDAVVSNMSIAVSAAVSFDHELGPGSYEVSGSYNRRTGAFRFFPTADAWDLNSDGIAHPMSVPARAISGRLSDDGELMTAQMVENPNCTCLGDAVGGMGATCGIYSTFVRPFPWCYVDASCPEAREEQGSRGYFWAACANNWQYQQECSAVRLARSCQVPSALCEAGWTRHRGQNRCYKTFAAADGGLTFDEAQTHCEDNGGDLASIHSHGEQTFIEHLSDGAIGDGLWIGLKRQSTGGFEWQDGAPFSFSNFDASSANHDCYAMEADGLWAPTRCSSQLGFACRKLPIGRDSNCNCSGAVGPNHQGFRCNWWDGPQSPAWCYVHQDCDRAVRSNIDARLYRAECYHGLGATTTTVATTTQPTSSPRGCHDIDATTFQNGSTCATCTVAADCSDGQYLSGACGDYESPMCNSCPSGQYLNPDKARCFRCDTRCSSCTGPMLDDCTTCDRPLFRAPQGACLGTCPSNSSTTFFKSLATGACQVCGDCGAAQYAAEPCNEFNDTICSDLSICAQVEYERRPPTPTTDRRCRQLRECISAVAVQATMTSDRVCASGTPSSAPATSVPTSNPTMSTVPPSCGPRANPTTNPTMKPTSNPTVNPTDNPTANPTANPTTIPTPWPSASPTSGFPTAPPTDQCLPGQWMDTIGTCEDCAPGTFADAAAADPVRTCTPTQVCYVGSEQAAEPTPSSDRRCRGCPPGTSFRESTSALGCQPVRHCGPGFEEVGQPTASLDRECRPCDDGSFKASQDTAFAITPCVPIAATCRSGTYEAAAATPTTNRLCLPCGPGRFTSTSGRTDCTAHGLCGAGQEEFLSPSSVRDRTCRACASGQFQSEDAAEPPPSCTAWASCTGGSVESVAPTSSTDRICVCPEGMYLSLSGDCTRTSSCGAGQQESVAPTTTTDRTCDYCPPSTFRSRELVAAGQLLCVPWTVCPGSSSRPSPVTDRVCHSTVKPTSTTPLPPTTSSNHGRAASMGSDNASSDSLVLTVVVRDLNAAILSACNRAVFDVLCIMLVGPCRFL